ncbi:MAG: hypothetical protein HC880_05440 [Bacteroidia bacterium]|nr:hypothetical protein [Bacteroidia bacterium]
MDQAISGEDRQKLLSPHLPHAVMYLNERKLEGFYLPSLGEGPILAQSPEAGQALLHYKHTAREAKSAIPAENLAGIAFMREQGIVQHKPFVRMRRGNKLAWQPKNIYGRIGGNFG